MSIRVMELVWACGEVADKAELLVLLALANWADDQGRTWPSLPRIAERARLSRRHVVTIIQRLEERGILQVRRRPGRGNGNEYRVMVGQPGWEKVKQLHLLHAEPAEKNGAASSPFRVAKRCNRQHEKVNSVARKGEASAPYTLGYNQDTSSGQRASARAAGEEDSGDASCASGIASGDEASQEDFVEEGLEQLEVGEAEIEEAERLAALIESRDDARERGSAVRRRMLAQRIAIDGASWVAAQVEWALAGETHEARRIGRDLARFADAVRPTDGGRDRLGYAERLRRRAPSGGAARAPGDDQWAGVG